MSSLLSANYISLELAARKYGISPNVLRQRVDSGKLAFARLPNGGLLVAEHDIDPSVNIKREDFDHLRGQEISMSNALQKYEGVPRTTIYNWIKSGLVAVLKRQPRTFIDEADIAYCVAVYKAKYDFYNGQIIGVPIFDENGYPYQARYPEMAAYKRNLRQRQKEKRESPIAK